MYEQFYKHQCNLPKITVTENKNLTQTQPKIHFPDSSITIQECEFLFHR